MIESHPRPSWLRSLNEVGRQAGVPLPAFVEPGMGTARLPSPTGGRFATFKRRAVPTQQAALDGVEFTLWLEQDAVPTPVCSFREPLDPTADRANAVYAILKAWVLDQRSPEAMLADLAGHSRLQPWTSQIPRSTVSD